MLDTNIWPREKMGRARKQQKQAECGRNGPLGEQGSLVTRGVIVQMMKPFFVVEPRRLLGRVPACVEQLVGRRGTRWA